MKNQWINLRIFLFSLLTFAVAFWGADAQVAFGGRPASFEVAENASLRSGSDIPSAYAKRTFNPEDLMAMNSWTEGEMSTRPLLIGDVIPTEIDFARQAVREELPNGQVIYRLRVFTDNGAKAINLYYKDFFIPDNGGKLFIYTPDKQNVLGAYTYETHPSHGEFATQIIPGSEAVLEYVLPPFDMEGKESEMPSILIEGVNYIFNETIARGYDLSSVNELRNDLYEDDVEKHECVINANCPEGDEWHAEKSSVVQLLVVTKDGSGLCSGALVNNTNQDYKPYILSAGHCVGMNTKLPTTVKFNQIIFTFHYIKPGCSSASAGQHNIKTMTGCTPRAYSAISGRSDGLLLEINQMIPESYRVYYAGWDSGEEIPKEVVGLHHPSGDVMKLSYLKEKNGTSDISLGTWSSQEGTGCQDCHFSFLFTKGDTYGGSSGSPLWNQDHRIVGTLSGGSSSPFCGQSNLYGRLYAHWDKFENADSPGQGTSAFMKNFLDPKNGGTTRKLDGAWRTENARTVEPVESVQIMPNFKDNTITVSWKDITRTAYPSHWKLTYLLYRNGVQIPEAELDASKTSYTEPISNALEDLGAQGAVSYGVVARYSFEDTPMDGDNYNNNQPYTYTDSEMVSNGLILSKLLRTVKPTLKVVKEGQQIAVSWKPAANMMELSNFGYPDLTEGKTLEAVSSQLKGVDLSAAGGGTYTPPRLAVGSFFYVDGLVEPLIDVVGSKETNTKYYVNSVRVIPSDKPKSGKYRISVISQNTDAYSQQFDMPDGWQPGQWIEVFLNKPKRFDPNYPLFVGLSSENKGYGKSAPTVALIKDTKDEDLTTRGWMVYTDDSYKIRFTYETYSDLGQPRPVGYPAIRPVISSSAQPINTDASRGDVTGQIAAYGKYSVPQPKILGYRVYHNGELANKVIGGQDYINAQYFLHDKAGISINDNYEVEVVYEDAEKYQTPIQDVVTEGSVRIYPSNLASDGILHVDFDGELSQVQVFNLEGQLVKSFDQPSSILSLEELPEGMYVVVVETPQGKAVARISR